MKMKELLVAMKRSLEQLPPELDTDKSEDDD